MAANKRLSATPVEKVFEHGFYPLKGGFKAIYRKSVRNMQPVDRGPADRPSSTRSRAVRPEDVADNWHLEERDRPPLQFRLHPNDRRVVE
ncbi:MAG: hypothetical protein E5W81_06610 [Mesorhizobium sp.]|nr:MAG: hypothetical protein E5V36_07445 [Mesorhizobium sp.]TKB91452.1 MAG: hypothetical protein E5W81_06610 [Mesorhizobium sp.]